MNQQEQIAMLREALEEMIKHGLTYETGIQAKNSLAATSQPANEAVPVALPEAHHGLGWNLASGPKDWKETAYAWRDKYLVALEELAELRTALPAQEPSNITDAHMVLSELDNLIHDVTGDEGDDDAFKYIRSALTELMAYRGKEPSADALDAKRYRYLRDTYSWSNVLWEAIDSPDGEDYAYRLDEAVDAAIRQQEGGE